MGKRTNTAVWLENQNRWQIKVQKENKRRTFTSSKAGRTGQREANKKADEWLDDNIVGNVSVDSLHKRWLTELEETTGSSNYLTNASFFKNWVLPSLARKKIADISEQDLQNILNKAFKAGKSEQTLKAIRGSINQFMKYARKCSATKLFPENLKIPNGAPHVEKRILSLDEVKTLFSVNINSVYICAFQFLVVTGLRRGELVAIQTTRDISSGTLTIRESINNRQEITRGKNKNAARVMVLNDTAGNIVKKQLAYLAENKIQSKYLFPDMHGDVQNTNSLYGRWAKFCAKNNIEQISLHELRHTFISMCKTIPIEFLRKYVGHSISMDTFGQYGHEIDGEKLETSKLIEAQLRKYITAT